MEFRKIIAIIRTERLDNVEQTPQTLAISGISVSKVKGYGEYMDFYERDWMSGHVRIEIFTPKAQADAIMDASHAGLSGDGVVVIQPVETVLHYEMH